MCVYYVTDGLKPVPQSRNCILCVWKSLGTCLRLNHKQAFCMKEHLGSCFIVGHWIFIDNFSRLLKAGSLV